MVRAMAKGAAWMVAFRLIDRALGVVSMVVLARLLVPEDFGIVAMAMSVVGLIELLGAFGFDNALIQRRTLERRHYDTAFTLNVLLGLASAILVAVASVPAASFSHEQALVPVMLVLAVSSLIQGFENSGTADFRRELKFDREFLFLGSKRLIAFLVTMAAAVALRSYWALVIGMVIGRVAAVALSYWFHPYRPRFCLSATRELLSFSGWLLATSILTFLRVRFAHFVIGRIGDARTVGLYTMGFEIAVLPTTELLAPINRAIFPAFAKVAHDFTSLKRAYLDMVGASTLFAVPAAFGLAAIAEPLVLTVLSEKWAQAVPLIQVLAFLGAAEAMINCASPAYMALGKPHIATILFGSRLAVTIPALIYAGVNYGIMGIAWVDMLSVVAAVPINMAIVARVVGIYPMETLRRAWRPLAGSVAMFFIVRAYIDCAADLGLARDGLPMLISAIALGGACYVAVVALLWIASGRVEGTESGLLRVVQSKLRIRPA